MNKYIIGTIGFLIFIYLLFFSDIPAENLGHAFAGIIPVIMGLCIGNSLLKRYKNKKTNGVDKE